MLKILGKYIKGQPGALKLPHTQGPGRGPTIWCIVRSLTLFFTQEAVSMTWTHDLSVTWQQLYQLRQSYPSLGKYMKKEKNLEGLPQLTSPGQTIKWKLLNKFAISSSGSGLTPLTCKTNRKEEPIIAWPGRASWQRSHYKICILKTNNDQINSVQISHVHNAEYIPLLEASKVVQEVISIVGKTLPEI